MGKIPKKSRFFLLGASLINFHDYLDDNDHHHRHDKNEQVSSFYTQQLNALMTTLHATEPHFIRHYMKINEDEDAD